MKLQRLTYPFREPSVTQELFGRSEGKLLCLKHFFTCAAIGSPPMDKGKLQATLDEFHERRKSVVGHRLNTGTGIPDLFLLGPREILPALSMQIQKDKLLLDFLKNSENTPSDNSLFNNTMGWLDVDSGCFILKSMTSLNRVRKLFGLCPHVALRLQNNKYGD